jgi:hypothetical protein
MMLPRWQDFHTIRRAAFLMLCAGLGASWGYARLGVLGAGVGAAVGAVVGLVLDDVLP